MQLRHAQHGKNNKKRTRTTKAILEIYQLKTFLSRSGDDPFQGSIAQPTEIT